MVQNLNKQDIEWLLNDYNKIRQFGKVSNWIDDHVHCLRLLKGSWSKPGCSCEWAATARIASSVYEQYETELKEKLVTLQTPVIDDQTGIDAGTKTRGRRVRKENTEGSN